MHLSLPRSRLSARSCGNSCWSNRFCCDKLTQPMHTHPQTPSVWSGQATEDFLITISSLFCLRSLPLPLSFIFIFVPWSKVWHFFPASLQWTFLAVVLVVQSLSGVRLFATPWTAARWTSLSFTISWSLLRLMSIESVMHSNNLVLCVPFPPAFCLSQQRGFFQWGNSLHQVAKSRGYLVPLCFLP